MSTLRQRLRPNIEVLNDLIYEILNLEYGQTPISMCQVQTRIFTNIRGQVTDLVKCPSLNNRFLTEKTFKRKCLECQQFMIMELESRGYEFTNISSL